MDRLRRYAGYLCLTMLLAGLIPMAAAQNTPFTENETKLLERTERLEKALAEVLANNETAKAAAPAPPVAALEKRVARIEQTVAEEKEILPNQFRAYWDDHQHTGHCPKCK